MRPHLSTKHFYPEYVEGLSANIFCTHVDNALKSKFRTNSGGCHTVLSSTSLGDDTSLSYAASQKNLYITSVYIHQNVDESAPVQ
jgi:hypothetical protein